MSMRAMFFICGAIVAAIIMVGCGSNSNPAGYPKTWGGTIKDADGNVYHTVKIGTQTWTVENLNTTHYNDGTAIPNVTNTSSWSNLTTGAYCWYNNSSSNMSTYGALYNWYAVNTGKLAPKGWHVPTDAEWDTLTEYLGGINAAGEAMKDTGTVYWDSPNEGAANSSGFSALPGGYRKADGTFYNIGYSGDWWSTTSYSASNAYYRNLCSNYNYLYRNTSGFSKICGFSIRLVRD
jgi:uncharacterized protein (TIGR02145 family)